MRKILTIICALLLAILLPVSFLVAQGLPADTGRYIEKKYAGWSGVLQAWICCEWNAAGSFVSWLNRCAADFEKKHNGVYIEFTAVEASAMREMLESNVRKPELIFFSPGVLADSAGLISLEIPHSLRSDLQSTSFAIPVAMGGYIWVYNSSLAASAPARSADLNLTLLADDAARRFSCAAIALLSGASSESDDMDDMPDARLDLGLPVSAQSKGQIFQTSEALELFIEGKLPWTIVTQAELKKLFSLREKGRGPDWKCAPGGSFAWTDQLLLVSCVQQSGTAAQERIALAAEFAAGLFLSDAQQALSSIGAFSPTGEMIYSSFSPYAELDALLASRPLAHPDIFSEYSLRDHSSIVRDYCLNALSAGEAFSKMGLELNLPIYPN